MKRFIRYFALLIFLIGMSVYGVIEYLHSKDQGHATEEAANAIGNAADAVADWTRDRTPHHVNVVAFFGQAPMRGHVGVLAVRATVTAIGAPRMNEVCDSMPVVRDALNEVLFDRVHQALDAHRPLDNATLRSYEPALMSAINHELSVPAVAGVRLAFAAPHVFSDTGCKIEHSASRK